MKTFQVRYLLVLWLASLVGGRAIAQKAEDRGPFDLKACVEYALQNSPSIKQARLDVQIAEGDVGEVRSAGLPQVNAQLNLINNYKVQRAFVPANTFDPSANPNESVAVQFGTQYNGSFEATVNQLIFDGTYFLGLKAADVYTDLSRRSIKVSETDITEAVTKAYYGVLVARERERILGQSLERVGQLLQETKAYYENGLVEELDVDRLEVTYTNLQTDLERLKRFKASSMLMLKFQMGMDVEQDLTIEQTLPEAQSSDLIVEKTEFSPSNRPEYSVLQIQKEINRLDIKRYKVGYLPSLSAFFAWGYNSGTTDFQQHKLNGDTWLRYGNVGLSLRIPIFDGLRKKYQIEKAQLRLEKTRTQEQMLVNSFKMQKMQSLNSLESNISTLEAQAKNRKLAEKVVAKTKIKYQEGVGSSLELIEAENDLNQALNNYYSAVYDALLAKVDYDKAMGNLLTPYQTENETE